MTRIQITLSLSFLLHASLIGLLTINFRPSWLPQSSAASSPVPPSYSVSYGGAQAPPNSSTQAAPVSGSPKSAQKTAKKIVRISNDESPKAQSAASTPANPTSGGGTEASKRSRDSSPGSLAYFQRLRGQIQGKLSYPREFQQRRLQGEVEIEVIVEPNGALHKVQIEKSSGRPELDEIALRAARSASPFEPFGGSDFRTAIIPIDFTLRGR